MLQLGESVMALGAVSLMSLAALHLNDLRLDNGIRMMESEFRTTALSLAHSYIEEAQRLRFDEDVPASGPVGPLPAGFTAPLALGPDIGEVFPLFDDVDDFHGLTEDIVTPRAGYRVRCAVSYGDSSLLAPFSPGRTLLKWLSVEITSAFYQDTLRVQYLYGFR